MNYHYNGIHDCVMKATGAASVDERNSRCFRSLRDQSD